MELKELSSILQQNGIVGAGGAGFPTYAKLNENAETIILNCAECEPLLRLHRQLLEKNAREIVETFYMMGQTMGSKDIVIGIKKAYKKAYTVTKGYGWWTYQDTEYKWVKGTSYDFEDHYVVSVSLTRKGERLVVDELPKPQEKVDEDLISKAIDTDAYKWEQADLSEDWEYIPNPFLEKKEVKADKPAKATKADKKETAKPKEALKSSENDPTIRIDSLQYKAYMNVDENKQVKFLKAGVIKAVKARNVQLRDYNGDLSTVAEVIFETEDATDAGRILAGFEDGQKSAKKVEFTYFYDKGWVLSTLEEDKE